MAAAGHAALSILLGFAVVALGFVFSEVVSLYVTEAAGLIMLVGGVLYALRELRSNNGRNHEEELQRELLKGQRNHEKRFGYFAVLGAALSPDLSILPIFLLAVPFGIGFAFDTAVVFGLASVAALLVFLTLGTAGLSRAFERVPSRYNDAIVGLVIAVVGAYILVAG